MTILNLHSTATANSVRFHVSLGKMIYSVYAPVLWLSHGIAHLKTAFGLEVGRTSRAETRRQAIRERTERLMSLYG